jgi:hypothetical protein
MKKFTFTFILLLLSSCSSDEKELGYYKCKDALLTESCINCTREKDIYLSIIVDKQQSRVMTRMFTGDVSGTSIIYDNCKIFNNNNWDCSTVNKFPNSTAFNYIKMNNGIYSDVGKIIGNEFFEERSSYGYCAK